MKVISPFFTFVFILSFHTLFAGGWFDNIIDILVQGNGFADKTQVYFRSGATAGWDSQYDAFKLPSNPGQPTLFTRIDGDNHLISINGHPLLTQPTSVVMGLMPGANGNFTFTADSLHTFDPGDIILLQDLKLDVVHNFTSDPTYTFSSNVNDSIHRFLLHFLPAPIFTHTDFQCDSSGGLISADLWQYDLDTVHTYFWDSVTIENQGTELFNAANLSGAYWFSI